MTLKSKLEPFKDDILSRFDSGESTITIAEDYNVHFNTVYYFLKKKNRKARPAYWYRLKHLPKLKLTREFGYIYGAFLGDGCFNGNRQIKITAKENEFLEEFARCISVWTGISCSPIRKDKRSNSFYVYVHSSELCKFIRNFDISKISSSSNKIKCLFIKGFFDAEGSVNPLAKRIDITNTDYELLQFCGKILLSLKIDNKIYKRKDNFDRILPSGYKQTHRSWVLVVMKKESFMRFAELINSSIKKKSTRMEEINAFLKNRKGKNKLNYTKIIEFHNQKMGYTKIAKILGYNKWSVKSALEIIKSRNQNKSL